MLGQGQKKKRQPPVRADVPRLVADMQSKSFLATRIAADPLVVEGHRVPAEGFKKYVESFEEVLATFIPDQQRKIIHGK
jgi:hypothetical protein